MPEMTVYLAWYSSWESNSNFLLGVFRTSEAAQKILDAIPPRMVMSKWIDEELVEDIQQSQPET